MTLDATIPDLPANTVGSSLGQRSNNGRKFEPGDRVLVLDTNGYDCGALPGLSTMAGHYGKVTDVRPGAEYLWIDVKLISTIDGRGITRYCQIRASWAFYEKEIIHID